MPEQARGLEIVEAHKDYSSPIHALKIVKMLLRYVPPKYLTGLKTIVLTNSASPSHDTGMPRFFQKHYWYLMPVLYPAAIAYRLATNPKRLFRQIFKRWKRTVDA